jgi:hypothetical protein
MDGYYKLFESETRIRFQFTCIFKLQFGAYTHMHDDEAAPL